MQYSDLTELVIQEYFLFGDPDWPEYLLDFKGYYKSGLPKWTIKTGVSTAYWQNLTCLEPIHHNINVGCTRPKYHSGQCVCYLLKYGPINVESGIDPFY